MVNRVNSPPVISAISDQIVNEGDTLSLAVQSTDPDGPEQQLTLSFDRPAPAGAAFDPGTGIFTWTPSEEHGPSTNLITVRVTDNGVPPLSATNSFRVIVNEVNRPPSLSVLGTQMIDELATLTVTITAADPDVPANLLNPVRPQAPPLTPRPVCSCGRLDRPPLRAIPLPLKSPTMAFRC